MRLQCTAQRGRQAPVVSATGLALSSSLVKRLKFRGAYTVNGELVFTDYPVRVGDRIEVCMDEDAPENYAPEAGSCAFCSRTSGSSRWTSRPAC